ncbi:MAG: type II toxin-antitoxin system VapC family toxin [Actinomycetota bacterium]|nr:type II toxin-antitoxin system VapC family toxin [Actinomycetota bacterium]
MRLYLDSSALVKLVQQETESAALRQYLRRHRGDGRVTSALARVEVVRAVSGGGASAIGHARRTLARIDQIHLDRPLLDDAATIEPSTVLRSLDAIHLASARLLGSDLRAVVTYDQRMATSASGLGLQVETPA